MTSDTDRNSDFECSSTLTRDDSSLELDVPDGATVHECPQCGAPFADERHRALHLGLVHENLTEDERSQYAIANEAERADLRRFRIVALGLLVLLYFGFLFTYAVAG